MSLRIETAIIAAAGRGARFAPFTDAVPKQMLPVYTRPALEWIVHECQRAGVKRTYIVTNRQDYLLVSNYFKADDNVLVIMQDARAPYGNASPLFNFAHWKEPLLYLFGDDIVWPITNGCPELVKNYKKDDDALLAIADIPKDQVGRYAHLQLQECGKINAIIEKPEKNIKKSYDNRYWTSYGRFIVTPRFFKYLAFAKPGLYQELWIMDIFNAMCKDGLNVRGVELPGKWLTLTDDKTYYQALKHVNEQQPRD
jgi:UTP--glucose-1-phosphate uridylyltransferase